MDEAPEHLEKVRAYFEFIDEHVIAAIPDRSVGRSSCFASFLLLCAAMDGLGGLIHERNRATNHQRFVEFLKWMPAEYRQHEVPLWNLRNALAHNALNAGAFLSFADNACCCHMDEVPMSDGRKLVFVHTAALLRDFCEAKGRLWKALAADTPLRRRAGRRLVWESVEVDTEAYTERFHATPPAELNFLRQK